MTKLELIEHLFTMQNNAKMKASYTADEVVGMLNEISVKVAELGVGKPIAVEVKPLDSDTQRYEEEFWETDKKYF